MQAINRQIAHYSYHVGQIVYLAKHLAGDRWTSLTIPRGKSADFNAVWSPGRPRSARPACRSYRVTEIRRENPLLFPGSLPRGLRASSQVAAPHGSKLCRARLRCVQARYDRAMQLFCGAVPGWNERILLRHGILSGRGAPVAYSPTGR